MSKEKILASVKFKKHSCFIKSEFKPVLRHQAEGFHCERAQILVTGACVLDDEKYEFQDIRVYMKEVN